MSMTVAPDVSLLNQSEVFMRLVMAFLECISAKRVRSPAGRTDRPSWVIRVLYSLTIRVVGRKMSTFDVPGFSS